MLPYFLPSFLPSVLFNLLPCDFCHFTTDSLRTTVSCCFWPLLFPCNPLSFIYLNFVHFFQFPIYLYPFSFHLWFLFSTFASATPVQFTDSPLHIHAILLLSSDQFSVWIAMNGIHILVHSVADNKIMLSNRNTRK
jgi:hypothetical protein